MRLIRQNPSLLSFERNRRPLVTIRFPWSLDTRPPARGKADMYIGALAYRGIDALAHRGICSYMLEV